jgi:hypothetical protein
MSTQPRIIPVGEELRPMHAPEPPPARRPKPTQGGKGKAKRSSQGRFLCINSFLDVTLANLDRAALAVWLLLWRDTKPDGLARTSQADLSRRAGCNPRTVRRALAALKRAGLVSVVRQGGLKRRMSVYRVDPLGNGSVR